MSNAPVKNAITETYSIGMARLLAAENLNVVFSDKPDASFDVNKRTLVLPNFMTEDKVVGDMLMSREVSRALNTNAPKLNAFLSNYMVKDQKHPDKMIVDPKMDSIIRIVEDAKNEKLIKRKYPGLKSIYGKAYDTLSEKDFFGVNQFKDYLYDILSLPDRLNIYYKAGHHYKVPFDWSEKDFVDRMAALETTDDVINLAKDLFEQDPPPEGGEGDGDGDGDESSDKKSDNKGKSDKKGNVKGKGTSSDKGKPSKDKNKDNDKSEAGKTENSEKDKEDETDDDSDTDSNGDADDSDGDSSDSDDPGESPGSEDGEENEGDSDNEDDGDAASGGEIGGIFQDIDKSNDKPQKQVGFTQSNFQSSSGKVIKPPGNTETFSFDYNEPTWKDNFVSYKKFGGKPQNSTYFADRQAKSRPIVNYLFKQFETKRRAHEFQRVLPSKLGGLDPNKLHKFSYDDEIFAKKTLIPNTKNHGLVMLIDFSGSMNAQIESVIYMVLDLVMFCMKSNIKYSVLGFTTTTPIGRGQSQIPIFVSKQKTDYRHSNHVLVELFSSSMTRKETVFAAEWVVGSVKNRGAGSNDQNNISLGSTPLNASLLQMPSFIRDFKKAGNIEIINLLVISDGDSDAIRSATGHFGAPDRTLMITDTYSKQSLKKPNSNGYSSTEILLKMAKQIAGVKTTCFYISEDLPSRMIDSRDNTPTKKTPIPGSNTYRNVMGYDTISFVSSNDIMSAQLPAIEKNLRFFIETIS